MMSVYTWKEWFAMPRYVRKATRGRLRFWVDKTWRWVMLAMIWVGMVIIARVTQ